LNEIDKITGLTDEAEKARDYNEITCWNDGFRKNDNSSRVPYFKWVGSKIVGFRWNNKC
jgi:hypothetical protein